MVKSISAVLPIYNVSAYLPRCLDSILATGYQDLEIVCVNDGSTDNSLDILRQYAARDSRFVVIDQPNGGISAARNAGLDRCTGEYVTFIDPDDFIHPKLFDTLLSALTKTSSDYAIGGYRGIREEECPVSIPPLSEGSVRITPVGVDEFFARHLCRTYVWGRLLKKSAIGSLRFDASVRIGEDGIFNADLWMRRPTLKACVVNAELYYYVQRGDSAMAQSNCADLFAIASECERRLTENSLSEKIYLVQAIHRALTVRYLSTHIYPDRQLKKTAHALLKRCAKRLRVSNVISRKQRLLNLIMIRFPGLYWLYRARQPGMLKWEINERKKRAEKRRSSRE